MTIDVYFGCLRLCLLNTSTVVATKICTLKTVCTLIQQVISEHCTQLISSNANVIQWRKKHATSISPPCGKWHEITPWKMLLSVEAKTHTGITLNYTILPYIDPFPPHMMKCTATPILDASGSWRPFWPQGWTRNRGSRWRSARRPCCSLGRAWWTRSRPRPRERSLVPPGGLEREREWAVGGEKGYCKYLGGERGVRVEGVAVCLCHWPLPVRPHSRPV